MNALLTFLIFIGYCLCMYDPKAITNHEGAESEDELEIDNAK